MNSQFALERLAHGAKKAPASGDDALRLEELARSDAEFLSRHPPLGFFDELDRRRAHRRVRRVRRLAVVAPALAACLAVAFVGLGLFTKGNTERTKGGDLEMFAYRRTDAGTAILDPDTALAAGDEIQIAYYAKGAAYAAILSVDGRGTVTRHMPLHGTEALRIDTKEFALLPYSYRLDDAPSFEDLYFVISPEPFQVDSLRPFLEAGFDNGTPKVQLPAPLRYSTLRIKKAEVSK